ncbi:uncharacterized protein LOC114349448 isoform X24 [Diabrotica virgifera virgifera]|uniref:Cadherin domain-containing protein n=1 Tax=Diabrotica virgifera virgifera TaxID=50390 RepID=A0ABM5JWE9_DIAVI|nr:uncharacterized protein LOC114349448 isoform X24 [Diabrotica virgifera virgifera]
MRLRTIIFLFCVLGLSNAQNNNNGNCSIEGFVPSDWTVIFKPDTIVTDEAADEVIFSGAFTGKLDDLSCTPSATGKSNYVDFEAKDGKFTIKTAADIVKLDEETAQTSSPFYLNYVCTMNCDAGQSQLGIAVKIADYNNHKPEFSQATYTYTVASPIMPHTDFTLEGDVIKATDLDFSNNNIIFTVDPPHFVIDTTADSTDSNKKTFVAKIRAKSVVQLKETTTTYTLTATDVGTDPGPLSQTASLTFTIDADNSLDIPSFEYQDSQTDYSFQYQSDNTLKPLSGSIKLNTQHSLTTKNFELLGDMKGKFSIEYDSNAKEITLSVQEEIKDPTVTLTVLTLNINNGQVTVSTPVIIYFTTSSIFKFDKHIYTGSYDDAKNQVNLDESITITSSGKSDVNIEIAGDLAKYFSAVKGTDAGTWSIKVATPAPTADELKGYTYLNLVLTATEDDIDGKDTASLLVKLPSHVLQFSKILYEATYNEDNTVTMSDKITFTTNEDTVVDITVDTNYEKYFVVSQEDKSYIIKSTTTPLPDEILSKQTEIAVIITAKDGYQNTQQAVVKITLPEINNEKAPKFTKSYYKSEYKQNQTDNYLDFTDPLTFDNVDDPSKVKISLDAYSDNFEIVYDKSQKKWRVHIKDPLTSKDFDSWTEILVIMEATESGVTKTGKSVLVIDLTTDVGPQFVELYYSAEYKQNDTKYIDFHTALAFEKEVDPKNLQITLDTYTNNFAVTYDTAQKEWRIQIKSPLSSKDFESLSEIVLTMEATQSGVNKTGKAVLVIELITETGPEFSKLYYASEYKQYQKDYIDFKEDVTFTENIDPNNLKITIDSYTDNFAVVYDTAQTKWRIEIKLPLNSQDFESLSEIVLTMEATEIGVTKTGKSVLVIELTTDATEVGPQFNELFYQCEYKQGQIDYLDFGTDIGFTENIDPKNLKIILNSYTDNFAVTYDKDEKKWRIQITVPLDSNVFDSLSEIILTMEAIETGVTKSGKAMLVIELKTDAREVGPQFKDLYYQSEYKQGKTDYIDFKTDVAFEEDIDPKNIKISMDSYTDNFAIVYDTAQNKWRIQINSPLSSKDFESLSEIVLTMEATESGVTKTGKSVLIIELKTDATEVGPQFKDLYYEAEYKQGQTDYIDFKSPVAFKADNDPNNLKISIDSYTNNFAVTYDATNKKWRIQIKSPLTSKDFESLSEIVITMEATESGVTKTGKSVLVIELKTDATEVGPQFKDLYYEAEYKEGQTDYIDFKSAVAFREDNDPNNLKISIDSYTDNFAVTYDTTNKKWRIQLISPLDSKDFESLSEIVITMEATESGVTKTGKSVLVIELKTDATEVGPQFKDLYYQSEYKQGQTRYIDFKTPVAFERDIDPKNIKISMDSYMDNFEVTYDTAQQMWRIKIKSPLDSKDFESLSEIVLTMEATESGITKTGKSVLVIELKTDATEVGPQFKDLYYQSEYKQGQTDYLDFKTDVTFEADNDPKNIEITIDSYKDNFAITYDTTEKKWRIQITDPLDSKIFDSLSEIVLTMEATETGVTKTGKSVLVIELKTDTTEVGPQFKELYYQSEYKQGQTDYIDFKTALAFEQDIDPKNVKISVDDAYKDNFAITYDTTEKKWRIQITDPLDSKIFDSLSEIVLTMEATETGVTKTGKSVLVIELKTDTTEVGPQFKELYYRSEYKQGQSDYIDFKTALAFEQDIDPKNVKISVDDAYKDNFAITYDTTEKKWRIQITDPLDSKIFDSLSEIVLTMEATETGVTKTGKSVLVIELKTDTTEVGPQFKELYYQSQYKQGQTDYIYFKTALAFEQDIDPKNVKISVDDAYKDNFAITYDTTEKKWRIQITDPLDSKIFDSLSEIVLTMEATETGITKTGKSVLVIELKTDTTEVGPQFKELYYQSEYKQGQTDYIDFKTALAFEQDIDPKNVKISVDDVYKDNFAVTYDTTEKKWRIQITDPLDSKVFDSLSEIILTMEATETGVTKTGRSVLVIELKTDTTEVGPQFKDLYYEAEYKKDQTDYIDFKTDVAFTETIDPKNLKIAINDYTANFDVEYDSDKWRIKITKPLDDSVFDTTTELILVMEASETGITSKGSSVLVIKLTGSSVNDKVPKFKDVYYSAEYPKEGSGTIPFDQEINFENIADISKVHIVVSDYTDYFSVAYDTTKTAWSITIVKPLDLNAVTGPVITTLSATIDGDDEHKPVAAFTLKLPELTAPIFSKPYYQAEYKVSGTTATVNLIDQIGFGADVDDTNIDITSNDYSEYFTFTYEEKQWKVVTNGILDLKELDRSDLVVSITATDKTTKLTSFSVIDLKLPNVNTEDAPKFSKTYYTASYTVSGDNKATVTLDEQFAFSNRDDPKSVTLTTDNYQKNFIIKFTDGKWTITVDQNLDADTLNSNDIVMSVIATDSTTKDVGECTLLMTLPKINSKDAPRFDKPYYQSECDDATTSLDAEIAITNKDDLSDINVSILEQDYKDNFNITFDDAAKVWKIAVLSVPKIKTSTNDLLLTLIATEKGNEELGQAALVLNFLAVTAPKFSSIQYRGSYKAAEVSSFEIGDIKITNKDKQDDIQLKLSLDSDSDISKYFKFTLTDNVWKVTLKDPLPDDDIKGKTELVLTLSATEKNNDEIGYATVIIALEDNVVTSDLTFSDVYYSADYIKSSPLPDIELDKDISLKSSEDLKDAVVEFVATDEFNANNYFGVNPTGTAGVYTISSKKELPDKILEAHSLSVVLQASLDQLPKAFATLVIDLPVDGESNSIDFKKALYEANYTISSDDERSFGTEGITIDTKEAAGNLKVLISPDSLYGAYFDVKQDNYEVIVTVKAKIPSDVYEKVSVIPLALEATSSGTQKVGKTVVNVNIEYNKGSVKFSSSLYNGNYTVKEGEATIYVDEIALATDQDADHISVDVDNDYHKYFKASYDKSKVTITKTADIPIADLKKISTISIQLKATVKNSKVEDNTVINLLIITDDTPTPEQGKISFDNTINTGEYSVVNGKGEFKEDKEIKLTTDRQNDEIEVKFSDDSEFKDKFSISYKDQVVTVEKKEDLSDDDFQSNAYISLEMIATITKSQQSSSAVLNIRMNNDGGNDNKHISFEYPAYKGLYNVSNNMADLDYEKITVTTDQTDENVEVKIAGPYNEYFDVLYTNKVVRISLKDTAASTTLRSLTNIPVVLYAQVKTTTRSATTVVNLQVRDYDNDNNPTESIQFPKLINDAQYIVSKGEFSSDDMVVVTNVLDEYIECDLSNDYHYEKYFQCNYKHTRVQVTLYRTLPKDEIKKLNNIALKVTISDKNRQGVYGDAILNIELKHQSETTDKEMNTTGYIVAISILSVLMFILLAGTAGFYFYKFRKSRYDKMTEDEYMNTKVRFDKSALKRPSNRDSTIRSGSIEERRPTGFIFNSTLAELGEEEPRDSSTDPDMKERKKSVAFDENVEKLQIDSVNDDDIDKALEEDKSEEASAKVE